MPRTVRMRFGSRPPSPIFCRKCETVHVERAVHAGVVAVPLREHDARELLARHRLSGAPREDDEHAELEGGQLQFAAPERRLVRRRVDDEIVDDDGTRGLGGLGRLRRGRLRAPQDGAHAGEELAGIDGFGR